MFNELLVFKFSGFKVFKCITGLRFLIWSGFSAHLFVKKDGELCNTQQYIIQHNS